MSRQGWRTVTYVALDFETTGLDPPRDRVVSFGAVPVEAGRVCLDRSVYRVVDPGRALAPETTRIHGIRPVDLIGAATPKEAAGELRAMLDEHPIVAWTSWVEAAFLSTTLGGGRRGWRRRTIDVRRLAVRLDEITGLQPSPARDEPLHATAERLGVPLEEAHHALADAFVTAQLFVVVATRLGASYRELRHIGR